MYTATGMASGMNRTTEIVEQIKKSVLQGKSIAGCNSVLLYFTASGDVLLDEIQEIAEAIQAEADPNANIIMGMNFDDTMNDDIKVVLFATRK
jgi:cell division protein FtsZ